ncbi:hypothetical protein ACVWZZ_005954 [Bradyrhizobium sp. LM6.10]
MLAGKPNIGGDTGLLELGITERLGEGLKLASAQNKLNGAAQYRPFWASLLRRQKWIFSASPNARREHNASDRFSSVL